MGRLITVVGNSGVGKTSLTRVLCQFAPLDTGIEEHAERPFQYRFAEERRRLALANQIDYLLLRAEQELSIRRGPRDGVQDGGLDLDYYVFTQFFYRAGYLDQTEYQLCQRLHSTLRELMGPPDVVVYLQAPLDVIRERFSIRRRQREITTLTDLEVLDSLLDDWLSNKCSAPIINVDASQNDPAYQHTGPQVLKQIYTILE